MACKRCVRCQILTPAFFQKELQIEDAGDRTCFVCMLTFSSKTSSIYHVAFDIKTHTTTFRSAVLRMFFFPPFFPDRAEDGAIGTCFPCGLPRGSKGCKWNRKRQRHSPSYLAALIARTCTSFLRLAVGTISMCPMTTFKSYRGKGGG